MLSDIWERVRDSWVIRRVGAIARSAGAILADVAGPVVAEAFTLVSDAVDGIVQLVLTPVRKAWDFLAPHLNALADALAGAVSAAYSGLRWLKTVFIPRVQRWIMAQVARVASAAAAALAATARWIFDRLGELVAGLAGLARWVRTEVLVPLWNGINGLRRWATDRLGELVAGLAGLARWVKDEVLTPLWREVLSIGRFLANRVMAVVVLVEGAVDIFLVIQREGTAGLLSLLLPGKIGLHFRRMTNASGAEGRDMLAALDDWADVWLR